MQRSPSFPPKAVFTLPTVAGISLRAHRLDPLPDRERRRLARRTEEIDAVATAFTKQPTAMADETIQIYRQIGCERCRRRGDHALKLGHAALRQ
jgi:hypothetical protein